MAVKNMPTPLQPLRLSSGRHKMATFGLLHLHKTCEQTVITFNQVIMYAFDGGR